MDILGIVSFAAIVVICYGIGVVVKATPLDNKYIVPILIISKHTWREKEALQPSSESP